MLLTVAIVLVQSRYDAEWSDGVMLVIAAAGAVAFLALGIQRRAESGAPPASDSVLLVAGLLLAFVALGRLAEVLGSDDDEIGAGTLTWMLLAFGAIALWPGVRKQSAICGFLSALAFGGALLAAWQWIFDPDSVAPFRWLLLALAAAYIGVSLVLRGNRYRHSELLVSAAGLSALAIGLMSGVEILFGFGQTEPLPALWEAVLVVAGCGLLAYAAADRSPGPALIGVALLGIFVALTVGEEATLLVWPLLLGALGLVALAAGLRPRAPLPPQPDAIPASDLPLAARAEDETVIRVRDEK